MSTGIHPTIAGVVVGLLTPVRAWFGPEHFVEHASATVEAVRTDNLARDESQLHSRLSDLNVARAEAVSPVERLQHALHGWVAFGIMPIFALANAGVTLGAAGLDGRWALGASGRVVGTGHRKADRGDGVLLDRGPNTGGRPTGRRHLDRRAGGRPRGGDRLHHGALHCFARLPTQEASSSSPSWAFSPPRRWPPRSDWLPDVSCCGRRRSGWLHRLWPKPRPRPNPDL